MDGAGGSCTESAPLPAGQRGRGRHRTGRVQRAGAEAHAQPRHRPAQDCRGEGHDLESRVAFLILISHNHASVSHVSFIQPSFMVIIMISVACI